MNYKKAANIALAYIISYLISIPAMFIISFLFLLPTLHTIQSGATNLNGLLFSIFFQGILLITLGVTTLVLFVITLVNGLKLEKLENNIGAILGLIGILVPVLSLVGSILIYIELKKKANESTK